MASNTTFNPVGINDFDKTKLHFDAQGVSATVAHGTTQNIDITLANDYLITGAFLQMKGCNFGDYTCLQIVDSSGAFTGTPGTVLNQFVTNWYFIDDINEQFDMVYPAKALTGMTIRIVYTSTGSSDVQVIVNYKLHRVLV